MATIFRAPLKAPDFRASVNAAIFAACIVGLAGSPLTTQPVAAPARQSDWPVPRGPARSIDALTATESTLPLPLAGAAAGPILGPAVEYGGPPFRQPHAALLTWTQNLQESTLAPTPVVLYGPAYEVTGPHAVIRAAQTLTAPNLLQTTLGAVAAAPFKQADWPVPRAAQRGVDLGGIQDTPLALVQRQGNNKYDWPIPRGAPPLNVGDVEGFPAPIRDYAGGLNTANRPRPDWPNPLGPQRGIDLGGTQDRPLPALQAQGNNQFDWPVPKGRPPLNVGFTESGLPVPLATVAAAPFEQNDWPNPRGFPPLNVGFIQGSLPSFLQLQGNNQFDWPVPKAAPPLNVGFVQGFPQPILNYAVGLNDANKRPADWPVPRGPQRSIDALTWTQTLALQLTAAPVKPFSQNDWPLPVQRVYRQIADTVGFSEPILNYAVGLNDGRWRNLDWPNPRGALPNQPLGWTQDLQQTPFTSPAIPAPAQRDWPNPGLGKPPLNTGFVASFPLSAHTPFRQTEWPVPRGLGPRQADSTGFPEPILNYAVGLNDANKRPSDWPVPRGPQRSIDALTWTQTLALRLSAPPTKPFNQNDWPLSVPRVYRQIAESRGFETPVRNFAVGLNDANKRKYDWPNPRGFPPLNVGYVQGFPQPLASAAAIPVTPLRWPVPVGPQGSISLRTWTQNLLQSTLTLAQPLGTAFETSGPHFITRAGQTGTQKNLLQTTLAPAPPAPVLELHPSFEVQGPHFRVRTAQTWTQNLLESTLQPGIPVCAHVEILWRSTSITVEFASADVEALTGTQSVSVLMADADTDVLVSDAIVEIDECPAAAPGEPGVIVPTPTPTPTNQLLMLDGEFFVLLTDDSTEIELFTDGL